MVAQLIKDPSMKCKDQIANEIRKMREFKKISYIEKKIFSQN